MTVRLYELPVLGEAIASGDLFPVSNISIGNTSNSVTWSTIVSAMATDLASTFAAISHSHAGSDITSGTVAYARLPVGSTANTICAGDDTRLSDSRTPTAHATSHKSGGSDSIKLDELAAPTDVTTLNASITAHGLMPKLSNNAAQFLSGTGVWTTRTPEAVQADYESLTSSVFVSPAFMKYHPGMPKCWINFNGTGTVAIRASHGISSITDNGTADYTITFTESFSSASYGYVITCDIEINANNGPQFANITSVATSNIRILTANQTWNPDMEVVNAVFFGDL